MALQLVTEFTVPATFPTSIFSSYYVTPGPTNQPQPMVFDPISNLTFPFSLTDPDHVPSHAGDPILFPPATSNLTEAAAEALVSKAVAEIMGIIDGNDSVATGNCSKCLSCLSVAKMVARMAPTYLPDAMIHVCRTTNYKSHKACRETFESSAFGAPWTQVLANADVDGLDGNYICSFFSPDFCPRPELAPFRVKFPKDKPLISSKPRPSGNRVRVLHLSDLHLDTRYKTSSEANCTSGLCCRYSAETLPILQPAPLFGYFKCDSPYYLAFGALQSIKPLTGISIYNPPALTLYTGDLIAHDPESQMSREYIASTEDSIWQIFKAYIGGAIYTALGNHDTSPSNLDSPHALDQNGPLGQQFSWNYDHVSKLWKHYGWINKTTQAQASLHYGAYAVVNPHGLKIVTLNTDFYYRNNIFAFINSINPDYSGMFSFLIEELQKAEDLNQRVWIVGHVPSGWDGTNALPAGSEMLYQIIDRYSPHVIANVFFGHTHEDQVSIYYDSTYEPITTGWIGPSLTPLTNMNSGYRMYEVDDLTWEIYDAYTYYSDVNTFSSLNVSNGDGPVFKLEYSTRDAYGPAINWPQEAPLNATFWQRVTEAMEKDRALVEMFNTYQGKSSIRSPNCTSDACAAAKICYIRSGSVEKGRRCPQGFGSVQSRYTGDNF
ncbi:Metallo-dependent phosphatase-like protein [Podospora fimiseda]|uniref:Sphingomyelin phosphodiesterase n=1 Tax=Podospora fimiseda TaxID=252190 RepID=A0AAN7BVT2_9PEZI|nr:Metallo-dependent phosphatase-like protein [Podospora fimiseda]